MDRQTEFLAACHTQFPVVMNDIFRDVTEISKIGEGIFGMRRMKVLKSFSFNFNFLFNFR